MSSLVCCARSVTALKLLNQMLSVRLGEHELIEWSLDVETHPYFNPLFHIWGATKIQSSAKLRDVRFDVEFQLDIQSSQIVTHPQWWMVMTQVGAQLTIDKEKCYVYWDSEKKFWTILRSIDLTSYTVSPAGFYTGMPIMFTGTDATNRWSHDKGMRPFFPPPNFQEMKPQVEVE